MLAEPAGFGHAGSVAISTLWHRIIAEISWEPNWVTCVFRRAPGTEFDVPGAVSLPLDQPRGSQHHTSWIRDCPDGYRRFRQGHSLIGRANPSEGFCGDRRRSVRFTSRFMNKDNKGCRGNAAGRRHSSRVLKSVKDRGICCLVASMPSLVLPLPVQSRVVHGAS